MKPGPTLLCGPGLHYSFDLRIQTYTELVPSNGSVKKKLATESRRICGHFVPASSGQLVAVVVCQSDTGGQHAGARGRLRLHGAPAAAAGRARRRRPPARLQRPDGAPLGGAPTERVAPLQEPLLPALRPEPVARHRRSTADRPTGVAGRADRLGRDGGGGPPPRLADQLHVCISPTHFIVKPLLDGIIIF